MIDIKKFWNHILNEVSIVISALDFSTWIESLQPLSIKENMLILCSKTISSKNTVNEKFLDTINETLNKSFPYSIINKVMVIADCEKDAFLTGKDVYSFHTITKNETFLIKDYTFDNFVVGKSNEFAFHAAKSVAQQPGKQQPFMSYNPLFIYSGVGLGKTHLLHSIGNFINQNSPHLKILYTPAETLTNDFIRALANSNKLEKSEDDVFNINSFREKYQSNDVLMIDDIQFLENKSGSQEVVFNIFNHILISGSQIVITSDRPPAKIPTLEDRLISRFQGGILVEMTKPNLETRIAIVRKKMSHFNLKLSDEIVYFIADNIDTNIRDLEGQLKLIKLYSSLTDSFSPSLDMVKKIVNKELRKKEGVDFNDIIEAVSSHTNITIDKIISPKRNKEYVFARDLAIYLMREYLNLPYITIGQYLGGRDHSTISHSYDKTTENLKTSAHLKKTIEDLKVFLSL